MKNTIFKISIVAMLCIAMNTSIAQPVLVGSPSGADINWVSTSAGVINGINTALIDYYISASTTGQLGACAYGARPGTASAHNGGIEVTDFTYSTSQTITYPLTLGGTPMMSVPDVIIGHDIQETGAYIMAVGFINNDDDVQIDYFDIVYSSPGTFTVTYKTTNIIDVTTGVMFGAIETVHLDVIAEYDNLYLGMPICDRFFVVYDADTHPSVLVYDVFAAEGSLTASSITAGPVDLTLPKVGSIYYSINYADNWRPDVAGIEYNSAGVVDKALITWENQGSSAIYRTEWYPGSAPAFGWIVADDLPTNDDRFHHPRIDANDDHNTNNAAGNADYMIVFEFVEFATGDRHVELWDELTPGRTTISTYLDFQSFYGLSYDPGPYSNNYAPAVAFGPSGTTGGRQFMITEGLPESSTGSDYFMMTPVAETAPTVVATDPSSALSYFQVNTTVPINAGPTMYTNAVATPPNNVSGTSLVAWAYLDGSNYNIDYKRCAYSGTGTGYAYKHSVPPAPQSIVSTGEVSIIPNPATDAITVSNVIGRYSIKNILGQVMLEGSIDAAQPKVNVSNLAKGSYIISLGINGKQPVNKMFVKD